MMTGVGSKIAIGGATDARFGYYLTGKLTEASQYFSVILPV